jgi:hypothetical protein
MSTPAIAFQVPQWEPLRLQEPALLSAVSKGPPSDLSQVGTDVETRARDGIDANAPSPIANDGDGIDTNTLTSGIALVGSLAGAASATTAGGLISGVAGALVAVIKGVEALGEDHKQNGKPNTDPMKMDRPIDKK